MPLSSVPHKRLLEAPFLQRNLPIVSPDTVSLASSSNMQLFCACNQYLSSPLLCLTPGQRMLHAMVQLPALRQFLMHLLLQRCGARSNQRVVRNCPRLG